MRHSNMRHYSFLDHLLMEANKALQTVHARPSGTMRGNPASMVTTQQRLSKRDRAHAGRLMRINHAGEVAAQGLYQGQALTARDPRIRTQMQRSAAEENDHLAWCDLRIEELGTHRSYLGPFWYFGSFGIGAIAGLAGDRWSLGFVRETERQVVEHLNDHLDRLPANDKKSRAILKQMQIDEEHHSHVAEHAGAVELPRPIRGAMKLVSKIMTRAAYWI